MISLKGFFHKRYTVRFVVWTAAITALPLFIIFWAIQHPHFVRLHEARPMLQWILISAILSLASAFVGWFQSKKFVVLPIGVSLMTIVTMVLATFPLSPVVIANAISMSVAIWWAASASNTEQKK